MALAAAAGAACTWAARAVALRWGIVNHPNPLVAQHTRPVAYLGGLGLAGGLAIGAAAAGWLRPGFAAVPADVPAVALAAGVVLFTALGLVDDLRTFSPGRKLLLQCAAAAATAAAGLAVPVTGVPAADVALGALWMVVLVNAVNLTDVCDGLVSSVAVAVFGVLALTEPGVRDGAAVVAGAALGVLAFNRPPASIFLGDAGAHLVGFLLAAATLAAGTGRPAWPGVPWAVLTCGVFLFELAFLITQRTRKGLRWWRGSPDHVALRLQAAGVGRGMVDAGAALAAAALAVCGAWLWRLERGGAATLLAVAGLALAAAWRALARLDAPAGRSPAASAASSMEAASRAIRHSVRGEGERPGLRLE
jgi:UDP-GlcNAc:undecaprenyl-phosphate GlcNAc-1-phosphate transferase